MTRVKITCMTVVEYELDPHILNEHGNPNPTDEEMADFDVKDLESGEIIMEDLGDVKYYYAYRIVGEL